MIRTTLAILVLTFPLVALSEVTTSEKAGEAVQDTGKNIRKAGRSMSDKACPMVNGKMDCAKKKMVHRMENGKDEVNDKVDDVKKKID